jgi:hypothetical protein
MNREDIKVGQILEKDAGKVVIDRVLVLREPFFDRMYPDAAPDTRSSKMFEWFVEVWVLSDSYSTSQYSKDLLDETGEKCLWLLEDLNGFEVVVSI